MERKARSAARLTVSLIVLCACGAAAWYSDILGVRPRKAPNILFIMMDTVRADHFGSYGYERATTPNLDAFARENIRFSYAVTSSPWTPPAVATMFTGLYPASHGMMPSKTHSADAKHSLTRLDEKLETLAELLKQKGYRTGGVTPNPWTSVEFGYDQGFDDFRFLPRATAGTISSTARELIDRLSGEEAPFFVYAHYLDPHDPYTPPVEYRNRFKDQTLKKDPRTYNPKMLDLLNRYDGEIAFMDKRIGELFSYLKGRGLYDDMVIVVIGDHGEQFMEHGDHRHGFQLYNEEIHVPLLLKADSSRPGKTVDHTVSNVDVFPTLLTLAGIDVPQQLPGVSLLDDRRIASREGVFTEIHRRYYQRAFVTRDGTKLLLGSSEIDRPIDDAVREQIVGVFDRKVDYFERAPLDDQSRLAALKSKLDLTHQLALSRKEWTDNSTEVQDSTVEQLKSLGYLQ